MWHDLAINICGLSRKIEKGANEARIHNFIRIIFIPPHCYADLLKVTGRENIQIVRTQIFICNRLGCTGTLHDTLLIERTCTYFVICMGFA